MGVTYFHLSLAMCWLNDTLRSMRPRLTFLLCVCPDFQDDTMLASVHEVQSLEQVLYLRLTVGTDHVEGISRLIGKICFLEKNQHERKNPM